MSNIWIKKESERSSSLIKLLIDMEFHEKKNALQHPDIQYIIVMIFQYYAFKGLKDLTILNNLEPH